MALDSVRANLRLNKLLAAIRRLSYSGELFPSFAHFLHSLGRQITHATKAFLPLISLKKGERYAGYVVHRVGHSRVHLADSASRLLMKRFGAAHCEFWARLGRVVGWNDPTFSSLARPKRFSGSFQPTLARER